MNNPANVKTSFQTPCTGSEAPFSGKTLQHLSTKGKKVKKGKGNLPYLKARRSLRVNALKRRM